MRALILLVCFSLRIFLQEIRSLGEHLEVVSSNAVTVFFYQSGVFKKFFSNNSRTRKPRFSLVFLVHSKIRAINFTPVTSLAFS